MKKRQREAFLEIVQQNDILVSWMPIFQDLIRAENATDIRVYFGILIKASRCAFINTFLKEMPELFARFVFLINWDVGKKETLLHLLVRANAKGMVRIALNTLGKNLDPNDYPDCWDVVEEAIVMGNPEIVKMLFEASNIFGEACDDDGRIAMHRTVETGNVKMTLVLFALCAPWCNMRDKDGCTPLLDAVVLGQTVTVQRFLEYKQGFFFNSSLLKYSVLEPMDTVLYNLSPERQKLEEERKIDANERELRTYMSSATVDLLPRGFIGLRHESVSSTKRHGDVSQPRSTTVLSAPVGNARTPLAVEFKKTPLESTKPKRSKSVTSQYSLSNSSNSTISDPIDTPYIMPGPDIDEYPEVDVNEMPGLGLTLTPVTNSQPMLRRSKSLSTGGNSRNGTGMRRSVSFSKPLEDNADSENMSRLVFRRASSRIEAENQFYDHVTRDEIKEIVSSVITNLEKDAKPLLGESVFPKKKLLEEEI